MQILANDGFFKEADFFKKNFLPLNDGVCWADHAWKCLAHYFDPDTGNGLGIFPDAVTEGMYYFNKSLFMWREGKTYESLFFLGACLHIVQDLCVPYHASLAAFNGHQEFESWARKNRFSYRVFSEGLYCRNYDSFELAECWMRENARKAKKFFLPVIKGKKEDYFDYTSSELLTLAQKTTSGFMQFYYSLTK